MVPGTKIPVESVDQRRWGGSREVGETTENGKIEWTAGVAGATEQECLEKVEVLLARLEANPFRSLILWEPPGATHATLYEARGTGTWTPQYESLTFEGAQLFLFQVVIPVAPLAEGLPEQVLSSGNTVLPAVFSIAGIKGDAPAKAEVGIETGGNVEESFLGSIAPFAIAVDATFIYWADTTGFIGRAKLGGTSPEPKWLKVEGLPAGVAVDAGHIYWSNNEGAIGRATITGGTIEKTWIAGATAPGAVAVDAGHIYWGNSSAIARATIAGASVEPSWIKGGGLGLVPNGIAVSATFIYWSGSAGVGRATIAGAEPEVLLPLVGGCSGIAVNSEFIYYGPTVGGEGIGRCALSGAEVNANWATIASAGNGTGLALNASFLYWAHELGSAIGRAPVKGPPAFALLGWAATPSSGLAPAPFGIFKAQNAQKVKGWALTAQAGAEGNILSSTTASLAAAWWEMDPATMVPDSFSGELGVEIWGRVLLGSANLSSIFTISARPLDGAAFGSTRYSDEWQSGGRPVEIPSAAEKFRLTRLGTLHLLVNPLAPRVWKLWIDGSVGTSGTKWGLDYLLAVPVLQRACSPTGKPMGASYPFFIPSVATTIKTVKSNLSALIGKPAVNPYPDHGLCGQMIELPPGEARLLVKLSSMAPDAEVSSPASEQINHEGKVSVTVTPRYYLSRTA